jgi:inorganic pyrophosphatase
MEHFFTVYKQLEGKKTVVREVQGQKAAIEVIKKSIESYKKKFEET